MKEGIDYTGVPSQEELAGCPGVPSERRLADGRVAVIECVQEIPCNPCETACPFGAIRIGDSITGLPRLEESLCTGCGACIASCPGLAIFVVDYTYSETLATVDFPYEYLPLPTRGSELDAVDRNGMTVCRGTVLELKCPMSYAGTNVIRLAIPKEYADKVRSIRRL